MDSLYQVKAPKFRSRKAFIAHAARVQEMKSSGPLFEGDKMRLAKFMTAERFSSQTFTDAVLTWGSNLLHDYLMRSAAVLNEHGRSINQLRETVFSHGVNLQIYFMSWELQRVEIEELFPQKTYKPLAGPDIKEFGNYVCLIAIFGNQYYFTQMVKVILDHLDLGHNVVGPYAHVTQQFIMRLAEHFLQLPRRNWEADKGNWAFDPLKREPLFQALWDHWADEDTATLEPLLMQLLNWHTYQASRQNKDGGQDYYPNLEQIPLAYFFILRLRQWRGLSVPKISHVLTQPPFDSLPYEVEGRYEFCPFAKEFYAKTLSLMPDFLERLNRIKIRDWEMII